MDEDTEQDQLDDYVELYYQMAKYNIPTIISLPAGREHEEGKMREIATDRLLEVHSTTSGSV